MSPMLPNIIVEQPPAMLVRDIAREEWATHESERLAKVQAPILQPLIDAATEYKREKARRLVAEKEVSRLNQMLEFIRIRDISLQNVFEICGYQIDYKDKYQYQGPLGRLSIQTKGGKAKFFNHDKQIEGGGAIDLVMHLEGVDFSSACAFLREHFNTAEIEKAAAHKAMQDARLAVKLPAPLPIPDQSTWAKVRDHLIKVRKLDPIAIDHLYQAGKIFSDFRNNACFRYGKNGIELLGTRKPVWQGFRGNKSGIFTISRGSNTQFIAICESAIDAICYAELYREASVMALIELGSNRLINTLNDYLSKDFKVRVAFNDNQASDEVAKRLMLTLPAVERHCPPGKGNDWNDVLIKVKASIDMKNMADTSASNKELQNELQLNCIFKDTGGINPEQDQSRYLMG
jgi:hypothetical protein